MVEDLVKYLWRQIICHVSLFFKPDVVSLLEDMRVVFVSMEEAALVRGPAIAIPVDISYEIQPKAPYKVPFNNTDLTLWNPIEPPAGEGWHARSSDGGQPLWFVHESGTHLPAWNLFGNAIGLLTFLEEGQIPHRDKHGRFIGAFSPRSSASLLEVPAFNDMVAALVGACIGIKRNGSAAFDLKDVLLSPIIVLSHDCDILHGNDIWTQMTRGGRIILKMINGKIPSVEELYLIPRNVLHSKDFYFNNIPRIISLEREFGYSSTFYILNGKRGRFGARSGNSLLPKVIRVVPPGWDIGIHYNYDTFIDVKRFKDQKKELASLLGYIPVTGRSHYLRFDSVQSFPFLSNMGIIVDESAGYVDCVGYRCGIGGCFQGYDHIAGKTFSTWELPLIVMDGVLSLQYGDGAIAAFERILKHLACVGGAVSVLCHPDMFYNPDYPNMIGLYENMLMVSKKYGYCSETASSLYQRIPYRLRRNDLHK